MIDVVEQLESESIRWADRPARCRRPPPGARRGRNCRRRRRSRRSTAGPARPATGARRRNPRSRPGDAPAVLVKHVQIVAAGQGRGVEARPDRAAARDRPAELPAEHPPGVVGVVLRVAAGTHVEEDAARRPSCSSRPGRTAGRTVSCRCRSSRRPRSSVPGSSPPPSSSSSPGTPVERRSGAVITAGRRLLEAAFPFPRRWKDDPCGNGRPLLARRRRRFPTAPGAAAAATESLSS